MIFASICSGIEAASVAWQPLGWQCAFVSEIATFPAAVLAYRFPETPNYGDLNGFKKWRRTTLDVLIGGTPCQSFSTAGFRKGLADPRGNLALAYLACAQRYRPRWLVWENVPGVLSSNEGGDFAAFLTGLAKLGYGWAYRILDARYFGLAQRRRRVFVVAHSGTWAAAAAVLFESESMRWDSRESSSTRPGNTGALTASAGKRGGVSYPDRGELIAHTLRADGLDASEDGSGRGTPLVAGTLGTASSSGRSFGSSPITESLITVCGTLDANHGDVRADAAWTDRLISGAVSTQITHPANRANPAPGDPAPTLSESSHGPAIAFTCKDSGQDLGDEIAPTLRAMNYRDGNANAGGQVAVAFNIFPTSGQGSELGAAETETAVACTTVDARQQDRGTRVVCPSEPEENDADAEETNAVKALCALRDTTSEASFSEWCIGVIAEFWPTEVLQSGVYGAGVRCETKSPGSGLLNVALSRSQIGSTWTVRDVWNAGCAGRTPQGWGSHEQLARELGAYLSRLPYAPSPAARFMRHLRPASERSEILRKALSAIQKVRQSFCYQRTERPDSLVRRLTPDECEALQGFPRGWTNIPYNGKPAKDGPRYMALGNSIAVPCLTWIGKRIQMVDSLAQELAT